MNHSFCVNEAVLYGVEKAVMLNNFRFWLEKNLANNHQNIDGYVWTFNSASAFSKLFPYMKERKISRYLKELEELGVILTANYNERKYDRTRWYSMPEFATKRLLPTISQNEQMSDSAISQNEQMDMSVLTNAFTNSDRPIPDITTDITTDINKQIKSIVEVKPQRIDHVQPIFDYWVQAMGKTAASKLTAGRKKCVEARLREGYTTEQIKLAIKGCSMSAYHMGQNDTGSIYDDLTLICRNGEKVEQFSQKIANINQLNGILTNHLGFTPKQIKTQRFTQSILNPPEW